MRCGLMAVLEALFCERESSEGEQYMYMYVCSTVYTENFEVEKIHELSPKRIFTKKNLTISQSLMNYY